MRIAAVAGIGLLGLVFNVAGQDKPAGEIQHTYSLSGPEMYKTWCASCHGVEGKGNGPVAAALKKAPTDLTQISKKNGGTFPKDRIRSYIDGRGTGVEAHGSREMPVWGNALAAIDASPVGISFRVNTLTSYIETLQVR